MPLLSALDISALTLTLALCSGLLLAVAGTGVDKPLARSFIHFTAAETGVVTCSILLRLSLLFSVGRPELLLQMAALFFSFSGATLFLFCARYVKVPGPAAPVAAAAAMVAMVSLSPLLFQGRLVAGPRLGAHGLVFYHSSGAGVAATALPAACLLAAGILLLAARPRSRTISILAAVALQLAGVLAGSVAQPPFPVLSFATLGSVAFLGWSIIRNQLFNPLRELAADLRERAHRLELISQIGRRTTTLLPLDALLDQAVAMIRESFDYFTVAVFLVEGDYLVLRASTHPAVRPHAREFRLAIGREGLCGWVAREGRP
ncbi:MAG TPA: hypothetical protein VL359_12250, partial [bacterium]|nr:hypothetical protein [bacterium]